MRLSVCLSVCLCVCLSVCLCVCVSVCLLGLVNVLLLSRQTDLRLVSLDVPYFADVILQIHADLQHVVAADLDPLTGQSP